MEYRKQKFKCLHGNAHGGENVKTALRDSCNIFFYNCAMRLGISKIDEYATAFGLGEKTGVEIAESLKGIDIYSLIDYAYEWFSTTETGSQLAVLYGIFLKKFSASSTNFTTFSSSSL